jgi:hypothetical protein
MDCLHCGKAFHDSWSTVTIKAAESIPGTSWVANVTVCPACKKAIIRLSKIDHQRQTQTPIEEFIAYPKNQFRRPTPKEVPAEIRKDYEEAAAVLPISERASAAQSRRCLQAILREQGYIQRDLLQQIVALLSEENPGKAIPTSLRTTVDAIRNFGNFSAHPVTDQTTLQVIDVEQDEAEWCLEILEDMFDHYYVKPEQAKERKAALDAKLVAAGKPPSR